MSQLKSQDLKVKAVADPYPALIKQMIPRCTGLTSWLSASCLQRQDVPTTRALAQAEL